MIEIYDHEIIALDKGPVAWMTENQGKSMMLDDFVRTAEGKFAECGFIAKVRCYETTEPGTYAFDAEIKGRIEAHQFDYDRQVHEVVNNILEEPDQEKGFIKTDGAIKGLGSIS